MSILHEIMTFKAQEVSAMRKAWPEEKLHLGIAEQPAPTSMSNAFKKNPPANLQSRILAEVKKASPSKGLLRPNLDGVKLAREYQTAGATAVSVLTDSKYFQGSYERIAAIRPHLDIPILAKEFIMDPWQILKARSVGADCILLIVAALDAPVLKDLTQFTHSLGMEALIEVHDLNELNIAIDAGGDLVGVNNRNLKTFETSIDVSLSLAESIPEELVSLSESGIDSREQIEVLERAGFSGFLIGEGLVIQDVPGDKLRELGGSAR